MLSGSAAASLFVGPGYGAGDYTYAEPGALEISIHGAKISAEYTGTLMLSKRRHLFLQANARGTIGNVTYDGWCSPWIHFG